MAGLICVVILAIVIFGTYVYKAVSVVMDLSKEDKRQQMYEEQLWRARAQYGYRNFR